MQADDGAYVFTGWTCPHNSSERNIWFVKIASESAIPEFPAWTPLLVMLVAAMVVIVFYKRRLENAN